MRTSSVYLLVCGASLAVAMVPALFPALDISVASYFLRPKPSFDPAGWLWVELINEHTPTLFRALVLLCLPAWFVVRRLPKYRHCVSANAAFCPDQTRFSHGFPCHSGRCL